MATPAAWLKVMVEADTGKASAELKKFDRALAHTDKTSVSATARTSSLNKATGSLGRSLGSAARYAAGAAVAYMSIAKAKEAITVTQDLAKTTAGLNRNLGLTIKQGSQWGAVAKSRDIDTKSLTMSFTTLSRRLSDAAKGSDTAVDSFKDIGVTQKQLEGTNGNFNKQLLLMADAFGDAEGGAVRQQAAQKLLGRGYQTLLPLFASGSKGLREQMGWADKYGATLSGKTVAAQMDLVNAQRESKVAWLGLQVALGKFVAPALEDLNRKFQQLTQILNDPNMTRAEKFQALGQELERIGGKILAVVEDVLPKVVEKAAEGGPKIAGALVKGFLNAGIWGHLLVGGWLIKAMGGMAALGAAGTTAGTTVAGGFGAGIKAGLARVPIAAALIGVFESATTSGGLIDTIQGHGATWASDLGSDMGNAFGTKLEKAIQNKSLPALRELAEKSRRTSELLMGHDEDAGKAMEKFADRADRSLERVASQMVKTEGRFRLSGDQIDATLGGLNKSLGRSEDAGFGFARNLILSFKSVDTATHGLLGNVIGNVGSALKGLGAKPVSVDFKLAKVAVEAGHFQRGGLIPGSGNGDKVPVMAEPGEGFINKRAVQAIGGPRAINAINRKFPRFQTGGVVEALGPYDAPPFSYDSNHAGGNSHWHIAMSSPSAVVALGRKLQQMGFMVSEHPAFGGIQAQHAAGGYHYSNQAIDVNSAADETLAETMRVAALLGGRGGALFSKLKAPQVTGPAGALRSLVQGAGNKVTSAANAFLRGRSPAEGMEAGASSGGKGMLMRLWEQAGGRPSSANLAAAVALAESGGNAGASNLNSNGSIDRGLWQINSIHGGLSTFDPLANARAAVKISGNGSNWTPWVAYNNNSYAQYLQRGGMVQTGDGPGIRVPNLKGLGTNDQLTVLGTALTRAEATPGFGDDLAILGKRKSVLLAQRTHQNKALVRVEEQRGRTRARIDGLQARKQLLWPTMNRKQRKLLNAKLSAAKQRYTNLGQRRSSLLSSQGSTISDLGSTRSSIDDINNPEPPFDDGGTVDNGAADLTAALVAMTAELKRQSDLIENERGALVGAVMRSIADMTSGEIGARVSYRGTTAGAGSVARI